MAHPAPKPKPIKQQLAESQAMLGARDDAAQTPDVVREAFLARRRNLGPVYIEPFNLGQLWLMEAIKHPLYKGGGGSLSFRDVARAIYIFHDGESAGESLAEGEESFDREALAIARGLDPADVQRILEEIKKTFTEGLATIPGGGASNPNETAS